MQRTTACVMSLLLLLPCAAVATTSSEGSLPPSSMTGAPEIVNVPLQGPGRLTVPAPNPTSGTTRIGFVLNRNTDAALAVYDLRGRKVAGLAAGSFTAGDHHAFWDGRDSGGRLLPAGTYCVELRVGTFRTTQKVMLTH